MDKFVDDELHLRIRELAAQGKSNRVIGTELGIGRTTAGHWRKIPHASEARAPRSFASAVSEMRTAAQRATTTGRPAVEYEDYEEPLADVWHREEERAHRAIQKARHGSQIRWKCPQDALILTFISDMHIAPGTPCDFRQMREDAELIRDTPGCYAILAGDQVDGHAKHKAAIIGSRSTPEDQYRLFEYYLQIIADKCIIVLSGNHDQWTHELAGVDVMARIARNNRLFYSPNEAWLDLEVGDQKYVVGVRHQYMFGSQMNQTHAVKQWLRMGPREFDIGVIGHHHEAAIEQIVYRDRFRWVARPGSYQITSAYSRMNGFNNAVPTCPTFLLHGDSHDISGWKSLRSLIRSTDAINSLKPKR